MDFLIGISLNNQQSFHCTERQRTLARIQWKLSAKSSEAPPVIPWLGILPHSPLHTDPSSVLHTVLRKDQMSNSFS